MILPCVLWHYSWRDMVKCLPTTDSAPEENKNKDITKVQLDEPMSLWVLYWEYGSGIVYRMGNSKITEFPKVHWSKDDGS